MANIIFPINPATGSEYLAPENGATYVFNGDRWVIFGQNLNGLATTGSNELSGSQFISGSVIIEGNLLTFAGGSNIIMTSGSLGYNISVDPNFDPGLSVTGSLSNGSEAIAIGSYTHAEGQGTTALGNFAHAEGFFSTAIGSFSHAEGDNTTTLSPFSSTRGNQTIASVDYQHVEGVYNVEDPTAVWIVGGGSSIFDRANIISAHPTGSGAATIVLSAVSQSLDFLNDSTAAAGGVPLGGVYRNGNVLAIRIL
jgi:hypothetical protein